jgi:D-3-phosphoglycerate dehydrogenase
MIRILNAEPANYNPDARNVLKSIGEVHKQSLTREELIAKIPEYDVLIVRLKQQIDKEIIDVAKQLKVIVSATTGLDHIDVDHARNCGITVLSLQGELDFLRTIPATAEHTWALLLSLIRRIPEALESVCRGEWNRDALRGHDLCGKRLGIVGLGRIGRMVARYGISFGMQVHAWDPHQVHWLEGVARQQTLEDLLPIADVLSLHVPLNEKTHILIGSKELQLLPAGAIVLNTARGDLIDGLPLIECLNNNKLAGAALDVLPGEREHANRVSLALIEYARKHSNLILTPHIGGATIESMAMTEMFMAKKLIAWLKVN